MYGFVVGLEYFTIIGLFIECWISLKKWSSRLHSYLFFSCVTNLLYNAGVLLELQSKDKASYVVALKLGYLGRIWIGLALFLFGMELCRIYVPVIVTGSLAIIHAIIYACILNIENNTLYYKSMDFVMQGDFPRLLHTGGILYYVQAVMSLGYTVLGVGLILYSYIREKNVITKKRYLMMTIAMFSIGTSYIMYIFKLIALADVFDVTIFGFAIGTLFMLIAIFKYKMLDAEAIARDYIVEELSEGIIVVDDEGRITYCNKPVMRLFPELAKPNLNSHDAKNVIERIKFAIHCEEPIKLNDHVYTPRINTLMQNDENVGTMYVIADDSEHYRYMDELRHQKQIADEANKAKSQFLANMSHEIRTPINAILGMDEMVLRESKEKEIREYAEDIQESGKTLLALVNDILDFSKVEEGKMEIISVAYETESMINDLVNMIKSRAAGKGLKFDVDYDHNIPRLLKGDEIRIKQCALNLLTNAVKYTQEGTVRLSIGFRKIDSIRIMIDFAISDTGPGIRPEDMDNLFSPFARIDEEKNRNIEGTGLGISITKKLLDLMGSELHVSSKVGEGSTFSFGVEQEVLDRESVGEFAEKESAQKENRHSYKELFHAPDASVLVVDDIKMNLTVISKLLKRTELNVDTALSGPDALKMASQKSYNIVFIDHLMPDMDGMETLRYMKEEEGGDKPVYIALTANAIAGAREMYLDAGFDDYISKPVQGERLEKLIMSYLPAEKLLDTPDSV